MKILFSFCALVVILTSGFLSPTTSATSGRQVLVVYPVNGPDLEKDGLNDSKQIADYYVLKRAVPSSNVLGVTISVIGIGYYYAGEYVNDVWDWLPGSVACDLNSGPTFGTQALNHGASAASYVIGEPYRTGHQRPDVLLYYLLNGYSFAEASTLATPTVGWMAVNEGDPLYAPTAPVLVTPTADFPKTMVKDSSPPVLSAGYPAISAGPEPNDRIIQLLISDRTEPEVAVSQVDYGLDSKYGSTASSGPGYKRRLAVTLRNLQKNALYHYRVKLTDPSGNVTVTNDFTLDTARRPNR